MTISVAIVSCKKDSASPSGGSDPETPISPPVHEDPEGTITVNLRNDGGSLALFFNYYSISINSSNNFVSNSEYLSFVNVGEVDGLGYVYEVPNTGWISQLAVIPENGYIVRYHQLGNKDNSSGNRDYVYARIYVVEYLLNVYNEIIGAVLKYQTEWEPYPTVITNDISSISATSAVCSGKVTDDGGGDILETGVCWTTDPIIDPTINDNCVVGGTNNDFSVTVTGLTENTIYYYRAYAKNNHGVSYGEKKTFITLINAPTGAINGLFSIVYGGGGAKDNSINIVFSKGNLQYKASTNTWRFAEHQWDFVGSTETALGEPFGTVAGSSNHLISPSYSGWIDLFGWGTSGYNHGAIYYQPWCTTESNNGYYAYGDPMADLNYETKQADWGYNAISNGGNSVNQWFTLDSYEWVYLFYERNTFSGIRFASAMVNNVEGVILLPDNWNACLYNLNDVNVVADPNTNVINSSDWNLLESAGAVFLPNAGQRFNFNGGTTWFPLLAYWTSDGYGGFDASDAYYFSMGDHCSYTARYSGLPVRLAQYWINR